MRCQPRARPNCRTPDSPGDRTPALAFPGQDVPKVENVDLAGTQLAAHNRLAEHATANGLKPEQLPFITTADGRTLRYRVGGPRALTSQMVRMISLLVNGHEWDPSQTPIDLYAAAAAVGYRRKAARRLSQSKVFLEAYFAACTGATNAHLVPTLEDVRRDVQRRDQDSAARAARAASAGYVIQLRGRDAGAAA